MRLWSLHPKYLDPKGLVALWREGLLAQKVLLGKTKGYKKHPQLFRFERSKNPLKSIGTYLSHIATEADSRGYAFNRKKIISADINNKIKIKVSTGQIRYEFDHLLKKLKVRDKDKYTEVAIARRIALNPVFQRVDGKIADWEKV